LTHITPTSLDQIPLQYSIHCISVRLFDTPCVANITHGCLFMLSYMLLFQSGRTPLHWSAVTGDVVCATVLLNAKAELNIANKAGDTPLHLAAEGGRIEYVTFLMTKGKLR